MVRTLCSHPQPYNPESTSILPLSLTPSRGILGFYLGATPPGEVCFTPGVQRRLLTFAGCRSPSSETRVSEGVRVAVTRDLPSPAKSGTGKDSAGFPVVNFQGRLRWCLALGGGCRLGPRHIVESSSAAFHFQKLSDA